MANRSRWLGAIFLFILAGCGGGGGGSSLPGSIGAQQASVLGLGAPTPTPAASSKPRNNATAPPATATPRAVAATPIPSPSATATPRPVSTPTPTTSPASNVALTTGTYPIYSSAFRGNTPFHHTVAQLMAAGATVRSSTIAANYWAQGLLQLQPSRQTGGEGPLYTVSRGDPAYTFACPAYGVCNAAGLVVHYPSGAYPETGSDHHIASFDPVYLNGEVDGWGGDGNPNHACALAAGSAATGAPGVQTCSWGGFFPFSGDGLAKNYSSGDAGGYAQGLMLITAQELLQGHIDHALGIASSCLDSGGVYPAIAGRSTDSKCPASQEPNARYGDLIHLKSSVNVAALGYSRYCTVIAQAMQTYGAYTADTNGSWGIALNLEYMNDYVATNPWYTTIFPSMVAGGDGRGSPQTFSFASCLDRIPAADIEVIEISSNLPPT